MTYNISDMEAYGRGWIWTLIIVEAGEQQAVACRTSQDRDGLWVGGHQLLGATQFTLSADKRTAKRQIVRHWQTR